MKKQTANLGSGARSARRHTRLWLMSCAAAAPILLASPVQAQVYSDTGVQASPGYAPVLSYLGSPVTASTTAQFAQDVLGNPTHVSALLSNSSSGTSGYISTNSILDQIHIVSGNVGNAYAILNAQSGVVSLGSMTEAALGVAGGLYQTAIGSTLSASAGLYDAPIQFLAESTGGAGAVLSSTTTTSQVAHGGYLTNGPFTIGQDTASQPVTAPIAVQDNVLTALAAGNTTVVYNSNGAATSSGLTISGAPSVSLLSNASQTSATIATSLLDNSFTSTISVRAPAALGGFQRLSGLAADSGHAFKTLIEQNGMGAGHLATSTPTVPSDFVAGTYGQFLATTPNTVSTAQVSVNNNTAAALFQGNQAAYAYAPSAGAVFDGSVAIGSLQELVGNAHVSSSTTTTNYYPDSYNAINGSTFEAVIGAPTGSTATVIVEGTRGQYFPYSNAWFNPSAPVFSGVMLTVDGNAAAAQSLGNVVSAQIGAPAQGGVAAAPAVLNDAGSNAGLSDINLVQTAYASAVGAYTNGALFAANANVTGVAGYDTYETYPSGASQVYFGTSTDGVATLPVVLLNAHLTVSNNTASADAVTNSASAYQNIVAVGSTIEPITVITQDLALSGAIAQVSDTHFVATGADGGATQINTGISWKLFSHNNSGTSFTTGTNLSVDTVGAVFGSGSVLTVQSNAANASAVGNKASASMLASMSSGVFTSGNVIAQFSNFNDTSGYDGVGVYALVSGVDFSAVGQAGYGPAQAQGYLGSPSLSSIDTAGSGAYAQFLVSQNQINASAAVNVAAASLTTDLGGSSMTWNSGQAAAGAASYNLPSFAEIAMGVQNEWGFNGNLVQQQSESTDVAAQVSATSPLFYASANDANGWGPQSPAWNTVNGQAYYFENYGLAFVDGNTVNAQATLNSASVAQVSLGATAAVPISVVAQESGNDRVQAAIGSMADVALAVAHTYNGASSVTNNQFAAQAIGNQATLTANASVIDNNLPGNGEDGLVLTQATGWMSSTYVTASVASQGGIASAVSNNAASVINNQLDGRAIGNQAAFVFNVATLQNGASIWFSSIGNEPEQTTFDSSINASVGGSLNGLTVDFFAQADKAIIATNSVASSAVANSLSGSYSVQDMTAANGGSVEIYAGNQSVLGSGVYAAYGDGQFAAGVGGSIYAGFYAEGESSALVNNNRVSVAAAGNAGFVAGTVTSGVGGIGTVVLLGADQTVSDLNSGSGPTSEVYALVKNTSFVSGSFGDGAVGQNTLLAQAYGNQFGFSSTAGGLIAAASLGYSNTQTVQNGTSVYATTEQTNFVAAGIQASVTNNLVQDTASGNSVNGVLVTAGSQSANLHGFDAQTLQDSTVGASATAGFAAVPSNHNTLSLVSGNVASTVAQGNYLNESLNFAGTNINTNGYESSNQSVIGSDVQASTFAVSTVVNTAGFVTVGYNGVVTGNQALSEAVGNVATTNISAGALIGSHVGTIGAPIEQTVTDSTVAAAVSWTGGNSGNLFGDVSYLNFDAAVIGNQATASAYGNSENNSLAAASLASDSHVDLFSNQVVQGSTPGSNGSSVTATVGYWAYSPVAAASGVNAELTGNTETASAFGNAVANSVTVGNQLPYGSSSQAGSTQQSGATVDARVGGEFVALVSGGSTAINANNAAATVAMGNVSSNSLALNGALNGGDASIQNNQTMTGSVGAYTGYIDGVVFNAQGPNGSAVLGNSAASFAAGNSTTNVANAPVGVFGSGGSVWINSTQTSSGNVIATTSVTFLANPAGGGAMVYGSSASAVAVGNSAANFIRH